ncbi:hypothetical protein [Streptomyces venezuelae]|uniref:hypothetical protein n=1 Tax=Streptomyces venezuelae TaxID=54571 RepID=UPI0034311BF1
MADLASLIQLLGAGSVGAVVTQYVSAGPERRRARATAREAMATLEQAHWAHGRDNEWPQLRTAVHAFESAAMAAGVPREVSGWYVKTRVAIYLESRREWDRHPDPEFGGGVSTTYMDAFSGATELVHQALWHPQRSRFTWRPRLRKSKERTRSAVADAPSILRDLEDRPAAL